MTPILKKLETLDRDLTQIVNSNIDPYIKLEKFADLMVDFRSIALVLAGNVKGLAVLNKAALACQYENDKVLIYLKRAENVFSTLIGDGNDN